MQTHDITLGKKVVEGSVLKTELFIKAKLLSPCVYQHLHLECARSFTNELADCTEANQTNSAALNSEAFSKHSFVPLAIMQHLIAFSYASVNREHHANRKFRDSVCILSWAVSHINALFGAVLNVDRVSSSTCSNNELEFRGGVDVCDNYFGRSNNQDVGLELSELCSEGLATELVVVDDFHTGLFHLKNCGWGEKICNQNLHVDEVKIS